MKKSATVKLYAQIDEACKNQLVRLVGHLVHESQIARNDLRSEVEKAEDGLSCIPVIDVTRATHLKFDHPFDGGDRLRALGYKESEIEQLRQSIEKEEAYRLEQIRVNGANLGAKEATDLYMPQFHPVCYMPTDAWPDARQTRCKKFPLCYSEATHLPPLRLDLLQMQAYLEKCVENLCIGVTPPEPTSRVYYDYYLDRANNNKLYLFLCIVDK